MNTTKKPNNPLHCWLYAIYTAHIEVKPLKAVVQMHEELQKFYKMDAGFEQFVTRHNLVARDPETLRNYYRWLNDMHAQFNVLRGAHEKGHEQGLAAGREQGLAAGREQGLGTAISGMLAEGLADAQIKKILNISDEELAEFKKNCDIIKH